MLVFVSNSYGLSPSCSPPRFDSLELLVLFICLAEVSSIEWEVVNMTEQEEDLVYRMYRLVGER